eukprot:TRINITY_DN7941_c0_g3_i1.p1 TRINITY_DN7941_c0_g3~~TRINITY_DN7941_c0_g3_i1.p1  ORF type:complete len:506 (+),score=160.32 TRINITY_DN7941_c0_g3_i1:73-1590(+)
MGGVGGPVGAGGPVCMLGAPAPGEAAWAMEGEPLTDRHTQAIKAALGTGAARLVLQRCSMSVEAASRLGGALCAPRPARDALRVIDLSGTALGVPHLRGVLQALKMGAHVERLSIAGCGADDAEGQVAMYLAHNDDLVHFLAGGNRVARQEEPLCRALRTNTALVTLDLSDTALGGAGAAVLTSLARHPSLEVLGLAGNGLTATEAVGDVLFGCKALRTLNVARNPFADCRFLPRLPHAAALTELNLAGCGLAAGAAEAMAAAFAQCPRLYALDVSGNPLGDAGARALLSPAVLAAVRYLHLGGLGMTTASSTPICGFLEDSETLLSLRVEDNCCLDPVELSDVFQRHRELPLKGLSLARTKLSEEGLRLILGTLSEYHRLQALVLDGLRMHSATLVAVVDCLTQERSTTQLVQFSVDDNPIADLPDVHAAFAALLRRNRRLAAVSTRGTLLGDQAVRAARPEYVPEAPTAEAIRFTSRPGPAPINDQWYSPSAMFHGTGAVDEP